MVAGNAAWSDLPASGTTERLLVRSLLNDDEGVVLKPVFDDLPSSGHIRRVLRNDTGDSRYEIKGQGRQLYLDMMGSANEGQWQ